jgi:type II secretory pathway predicted ATPase ExeA
MNPSMLSFYGLKFNPFSSDIPASSLYVCSAVEDFCWRIEQQTGEGGFALITGEPGAGKSATLRILAARLGNLRDVTLGALSRSQASVSDFYRELGHLFSVPLAPHNRWNSARSLREKWQTHIHHAHTRPVLLVDDAQEMSDAVFCELRLLASAELDSRSLLCSVLAGDNRLLSRLQEPELFTIATRIRTRLRSLAATPAQLRDTLAHLLHEAGNPTLMTEGVQSALAEHALGNHRTLSNMANDLLIIGARKEIHQIDESLFFEAFDPKAAAPATKTRRSIIQP